MEILRYAAFTTDPGGGNPAGVVPDATGLSDDEMQSIAADLGYSETAFLFPTGAGTADVRYFAPLTEVPFCGHATIASGIAMAERTRPGDLLFNTKVGPIPVATVRTNNMLTATLTSRPPTVAELSDAVRGQLLAALRLTDADLDPLLPIRLANTGNSHPVVAVTVGALNDLDYAEDDLRTLMFDHGWITVQVVHRLSDNEFDARNPFPIGGVREDPATGSAASALGGYLRELGIVNPPAQVIVYQGRHVGRPGVLTVDIPAEGGISVTGTAIQIV